MTERVLTPNPLRRMLIRATAASLLCLAASTATASGTAFEPPTTGQAYAPEDNTLLYRLRINYASSNGEPINAQILYRGADGQRLAESRLDFSADPYAPDISTIFQPDGNEQGLIHENWSVLLFHADGPGATMRGRRKKPPPDLAADLGIARFVHAGLDELLAGQELRFSIASPARRKIVRAAAELDAEHSDRRLIRVHLRSGFGPMTLVFERESRRLAGYAGPSVLTDKRGRPLSVRVRYEYGQF